MQNYEQFMRSDAWAKMRQAVLKRDSHECQTCKCQEQLEVHHKVYRYPLETQDLGDLITLCHWCHEAITGVIRKRRYSKRSYQAAETKSSNVNLEELFTHDVAKIELQDYRGSTPTFAQRANRRPDEQVRKSYEASEQQARQDGRRF